MAAEVLASEKEPVSVLVVDDEAPIRVALGRSLRRLGCDIREASDGATALAAIAERPPQVIFLDLRMQGMDGHTLLRRLREQGCDAAVVVVSGQGGMEDVVEVLRAGAVDYLKKPWNPAELLAAFARAVEQHDERRRRRETPADAAAPAAAERPAPREGAPVERIIEQIAAGEILVPSAPAVVLKIRELLSDPAVNLDEVAAIIERDQRFAADLIRLSNTAKYARGGRNSSVRAAVTRLGLRQVHAVAETLFLKGLFGSDNPFAQELLGRIWRHAVARAIAMRGLADLLANDETMDPDTAYLIGLLCDVGASFMVAVSVQRSPDLSPADGPWLAELIDLRHASLSAVILERWGFGELIVAAVRDHHQGFPTGGGGSYWQVGCVAQVLAEDLTGAPDPSLRASAGRLLSDRCAAELRLGANVLPSLLAGLRGEYAEAVATA